ncbi:hypothetical protein GBAR_LOCUS31575 [Geodia barretti]|uniref:Cupin-like domain-containing protein n=1 Tax=Geodia barretti TaxID=519541 RepID=A0AA35XN92_GEOBA|nr:hypothetical protein GBAR_LOCUS31575 [Geodia barretti]
MGYLRERFGGEEVNVEHKKKENRSETGFLTNMADYLDRYEGEDIYMVSPLTPAMQREWLLPQLLLCGGFTQNLIFSYAWYNNHTIVDLLSHPGLVSVPWHRAVVWPGDCLFLPHLWIHHVTSRGRNLGVNLWLSAFMYDSEDCSAEEELPDFAPLSDYHLVPELQLKQGLLTHADDNGLVYASEVHLALSMRQGMEDLQLEAVVQIFESLKPGCQGQLRSSEIHSLPVESFVSAFRSFMSTVHPEEEDEWGDEGGEWGEGGWEGGGEEDWGYSELGDEWEEEEEEGGGGFPHDHQPHEEL